MERKEKAYFRENWPEHYYEIEDINEREQILKEILEENPDSVMDKRRLEVLQKRFGKSRLPNRPDHFMHAMLMIRQMQNVRVNSLNREKKNGEFIGYADELSAGKETDEVLCAEYHDLMKHYINVTAKSFSRPAFLGMGKRTADKVKDSVKEDIRIIVAEIPHRFNYDKEFETLRTIAAEEIEKMK